MRKAVVAVGAAVLAAGLPIATYAAETRVACGSTVRRSIVVANSLLNCPTHGLAIDANGITVDLGGNTIDGEVLTGEGSDSVLEIGIRCLMACEDVTIKNGTVAGFETGILLGVSTRAFRLAGLTALDNGTGVLVQGPRTVLRNMSAVGNSAFGFQINGRRNVLRDNVARRNDSGGYQINGQGNLVEDNSAVDNGEIGFDVNGPRNQLVGNSSEDNGVTGYEVEQTDNVLTRNRSRNDGAFGFEIGGTRTALSENVAMDAGFDGFFVTGPDHTLDGDAATGNDRLGFQITSGASDVVLRRLVARGNEDNGMTVLGRRNELRAARAVGNGGDGISVFGSDQVLVNNAANQNLGFGFRVDPSATVAKAANNTARDNLAGTCVNIACN